MCKIFLQQLWREQLDWDESLPSALHETWMDLRNSLPQMCAGRICAVMTRPIPGYNHTFMLCSLVNNNFMPLNNVALYLDSEKNHLVPVPREALLEPPRLADGHPMSAVFADIDFRGGHAVGQYCGDSVHLPQYGSPSFGDTINEDEELSLHEDQLQSNNSQILALS
ncbi:Hypothetical predicted protein [Drosophila guanche]|uniref:Uncharacterized protein n=4 Tax=Drosophila guanche TaxID=7266 RepID=A0A3B0KAP7_DROGU|nr:Hypothetical predicted protein [Drosophila guanche]